LQSLPRIELTETLATAPELPWQPAPAVQAERRDAVPYARLAAHLSHYPGPTVLVAESLGRRETLANVLAEQGIATVVQEGHVLDAQSLNGRENADTQATLILTTGPLATGFVDRRSGLCLLTETELYARASQPRRGREARKSPVEGLIRDLSELKIGDPVVHTEHGIGRYLGLTTLNLGEGDEELLHLEYAKGDKLFVPVAHLHLIARYLGADPEHAPLHALGSPQWEKAKRRAQEKARDTAAELLNLYALRAAREGYRFDWRESEMETFAEGFGFDETPDQAAAIEAVLTDMRSGQPMDRLVCGDVGFGKTEVALRAAFAAVADNKQVIVLCPTTLLAEQHFQTFSDRFSDLPVRIAELSRFRSSKEINAALAGLAKGSVDIVIGTHKLLQPDVRLARLGLVIIDEEHRFGVRQKEALRSLRAEVDCLALTATPIPRTLAMSLEGIRDFSVITTAPSKRLAIKTFVQPESDGLIREAVLRELKRGGQIYFLHNEVETIQAMRVRLEQLLPEARIEVAHGQMPERDLEHVMRDFYHQRFNLLLCTTIIETGINVPTANTILMHRADKFGLAQLHQLRGRVGRSHHQAYAYLLTPPGEASITRQAHKRLEAICQMEELGSGFHLAMQDLEIRGAGEVLGESQSGEMQEVGFNLYSDMLTQAVEALKSGQQPDMDAPLAVTAEINLHLPARLPDAYCNDVHERLVLYKRLASCGDESSLNELKEEMIDRFGLLPEPSEVLLAAHRLRIRIQPLGIRRLDASETGLVVQFVPKPPIDPMRIITLIQTRRDCKLAGPDRIRISLACPGFAERLAAIESLIKALS
ncbi:MAG: transcription-repair coupling factor, partial [Betaproteobacteria bacterium]|nr:transcription-repair coupling factor [Betaproteobacteria bacterium]